MSHSDRSPSPRANTAIPDVNENEHNSEKEEKKSSNEEEEEEEEIMENVCDENTTSNTIKNERRAECDCTEYMENPFKKGGLCTRCLHPKAAHVDGHCEALSLFYFKRLRRRKKKINTSGSGSEYEYFDGDIPPSDDDSAYEYVDEDGKVVDPPTPQITISQPKVEVKEVEEKIEEIATPIFDDISPSLSEEEEEEEDNSDDDDSDEEEEVIEEENEKNEEKEKEEEEEGKNDDIKEEEEKEEEKPREMFVEIFDDGYYDEENKFHPYNNDGYDEFGGYYDDDGYYCDENGFYDDNGDYHEFKGFDECKEFITQTDNLEDGFNAELHALEKELKETENSAKKAKKAKKKKRGKELEELEAAKQRQQKRKERAKQKKLAKLEKKKKKKKRKKAGDSDDDDDDSGDSDEDYYNDMDEEDKEEVDKIKSVVIAADEGTTGGKDAAVDARLTGRWCAEEELPDREEPELRLIMGERVDEDDERELMEEKIKEQNAAARRHARDMREKAILEKKERLNRQKKLREYEPPAKDNSSPFDMISFVRKAVPDKTSLYRSRVLKTRRGCLAMIYEGYKDEDREREILYAKKMSPSRYLVSVNEDFSKSSEGVVAELLIGQNMEYTTLKELDYTEYTDDRNELIGVWRLPYKSSDEPIRLNVVVPSKFLVTYTYWKSTDGVLVHMLKAKETDDLTVLETKKPIWDDIHNQRILNFHGRVKASSIKNIQLVDPKETRKVLLQFGRVDHSTFILDYKHPFSAVQAFAVAVTMIT